MQATVGDDELTTEALDELPEEYLWLDGGQPYIACAFYTPNYLPQITSLKRSLEAHKINHFLKRVDPAMTWEATTRMKPVFVDECVNKFPDYDILYLDADSVVRQPLDFFDTMDADVSIFFHPTMLKKKHVLRIAAGTVYVKNSDGGKRFARLWRDQEEKCGPLNVDEDMVYMAFSELAGVSIRVLPRSYYKIFDAAGQDPVIEHFQASRKQSNKGTRWLRRAKRFGRIAAALAALGLLWWLSQNIQISWIG